MPFSMSRSKPNGRLERRAAWPAPPSRRCCAPASSGRSVTTPVIAADRDARLRTRAPRARDRRARRRCSRGCRSRRRRCRRSPARTPSPMRRRRLTAAPRGRRRRAAGRRTRRRRDRRAGARALHDERIAVVARRREAHDVVGERDVRERMRRSSSTRPDLCALPSASSRADVAQHLAAARRAASVAPASRPSNSGKPLEELVDACIRASAGGTRLSTCDVGELELADPSRGRG